MAEKESLTVGVFRPEDARGVAELFTGTYGDGYPAKIVYNPDQLIAAFERRDNIPIVVRTEGGRIVGYSAFFRPAPDRGVYEKGNGAVAADFRNAGIMKMIFEHVREVLPDFLEMTVFFGEPVCNHVFIQKAALSVLPFVETALEVDLMPADAYEKEQSATGRVSTLLMFITRTPRPHTVYAPERYADHFRFLYEGLDDRRTIAASRAAFPPFSKTRLATVVFDAAQVARVTVHEAGNNLKEIFQEEEKKLAEKDIKVIQIFINLSQPWSGKVVGILNGQGCFWGGILPQWFGEDGLLMQKVISPPNWAGIHLASDRARRIVERVQADWQSVQSV
jgi:hypothetical protein